MSSRFSLQEITRGDLIGADRLARLQSGNARTVRLYFLVPLDFTPEAISYDFIRAREFYE